MKSLNFFLTNLIFVQSILSMQPSTKELIKKGALIGGLVITIGAIAVCEARYATAKYGCQDVEEDTNYLRDQSAKQPHAKPTKEQEDEVRKAQEFVQQCRKYAVVSRLIDYCKQSK